MNSRITTAIGALVVLYAAQGSSRAADVKTLSPVSMRGAMTDIAKEFEKTSGHKLSVDYATAGAVVSRVQAGEAADVAIVSDSQVEALTAKGRVAPGTRAGIARVGVGLFVKHGASKASISSVSDFRKALLSARAIGYGDPAAGGVSGIHMSRVVGKLGLVEELEGKVKLFPDSQAVMNAVARGDVDIGFGLTSDATIVTGIELAAPLPADLQNFTDYSAAVVANARSDAAAREFVNFLSAPVARAIWESKGFETR